MEKMSRVGKETRCRFEVEVSIYLVGVMNKKGQGEDVENTDAPDNVIAIAIL